MIDAAIRGILHGLDVYAFLLGIVALGELAGYCGLFDWLAAHIARIAGGSGWALFTLLFALGVGVTAVLSNDTTAVMLTPAVLATARSVRVAPLPALYACAFVANAASFILPISNPANLVVFDGVLPTLTPWLRAFAVPSVAAIVVTFAVLAILFRTDIGARYEIPAAPAPVQRAGIVAATVLALSALAMIVAAAVGANVGYTALLCAILSSGIVSRFDRSALEFVLSNSAWRIVMLTAALFALVAVLDHVGAVDFVRAFLVHAQSLGVAGVVFIGATITALSSLVNNLPVAMLGGVALQSQPLQPWAAHALLIRVDLGPNLALSGSLATLIWIERVRRAGIPLPWWRFLGVGALVVVPSLAVALLL